MDDTHNKAQHTPIFFETAHHPGKKVHMMSRPAPQPRPSITSREFVLPTELQETFKKYPEVQRPAEAWMNAFRSKEQSMSGYEQDFCKAYMDAGLSYESAQRMMGQLQEAIHRSRSPRGGNSASGRSL